MKFPRTDSAAPCAPRLWPPEPPGSITGGGGLVQKKGSFCQNKTWGCHLPACRPVCWGRNVRARLLPPPDTGHMGRWSLDSHTTFKPSSGGPVGEKHPLKPIKRASGCPGVGLRARRVTEGHGLPAAPPGEPRWRWTPHVNPLTALTPTSWASGGQIPKHPQHLPAPATVRAALSSSWPRSHPAPQQASWWLMGWGCPWQEQGARMGTVTFPTGAESLGQAGVRAGSL